MKSEFTYLTQAQFDKLLKSGGWTIEELDLTTIRLTPRIERKQQLLGGFCSGDYTSTQTLNGQIAIMGLDILVHEERPFRSSGEGDVNVYHYIVTRTGRSDFPYALRGPYTKETLIGHWPTGLPLDPYYP